MDIWSLFSCLLLGFHLLACTDADETYCTRMVSTQTTTYVRVSRSQIIATYYRCWLFWTCTTYRYTTTYSSEPRTRITYGQQHVCCDGYTWNSKRYSCIKLQGPDVDTTATLTVITPVIGHLRNVTDNSSTRNISVPTDRYPENGTSPEGLMITSTATNRLVTTLQWHSTSSSMSTSERISESRPTSFLALSSSKMPLGAKILFGAFAGLVVVASIIMIACLVRRRQKKRLKQNKIDTMHMEPLRDLQLISERGAAIQVQHFTPPFAPNDEYAVVDKGKETNGVPDSSDQTTPHYENTVIHEVPKTEAKLEKKSRRKSPLNTMVNKMKINKGKRLTHTYIDGREFSLGVEEGHEWRKEETAETNYSQIEDDRYVSTEEQTKSKQDVYEAIEETDNTAALTYDHLEREISRETSKDNEAHDSSEDVPGNYGVLVQSSSVDKQEDYDLFHRSASQTPDQPSDNGYGAINDPHANDQNEAADKKRSSDTADIAYDEIKPGLTDASGKKSDFLSGLPHSDTVRAAYGHLGSSMESDPGDPCAVKSTTGEHTPSNNDLRSIGLAADDRDSVYTDMSGSFSDTTLPARVRNDQAYTPMSPCSGESSYFNVSVDVEEVPLPTGDDDQYSSILEGKQDTYDHVERKLDGGRLEISKDNPGDNQESRSGKANVSLIYENM